MTMSHEDAVAWAWPDARNVGEAVRIWALDKCPGSDSKRGWIEFQAGTAYCELRSGPVEPFIERMREIVNNGERHVATCDCPR